MSDKKYYFIEEGQKRGPFTKEEFLEEEVFSSTLVWFRGQSDWIALADIPELKDALEDIPPPIPSENISEPIRVKIQKEKRKKIKIDGSKIKSSIATFVIKFFKAILIFLVTFLAVTAVLAAVVVTYEFQQNQQEYRENIELISSGGFYYGYTDKEKKQYLEKLKALEAVDYPTYFGRNFSRKFESKWMNFTFYGCLIFFIVRWLRTNSKR